MRAYYFLLIVLGTVCVNFIRTDSPDKYRGHIIKTPSSQYEVYTAPNDSYREPNGTDNVLARAFWDQTYNTTGWSVLEVVTEGNQTNQEQAYAAGLLEGRLTRDLIALQKLNNIDDVCRRPGDFCQQLKRFVSIQLDWIYDQIKTYPDSDYWHQIELLLIQLNGLIDGNAGLSPPPGPRHEIVDPIDGLFLFQIIESTGELAARFNVSDYERPDSCSALIKILPDGSDVFVSHADWSHYKTMLKVIKRYIMPLRTLKGALLPAAETIFSSYPGTLHSVDDFYMTFPAQMVIIETTIENHNPDLFHNILPISVPEWMRIVVANRLSNSGDEWMNKFFLFNDGTYNNQWMISDFKKFTPHTKPDTGFLTVGEQMVTFYKWEDLTYILNNQSYWASYNNVYFPEFRQLSQEDLAAEKLPQLYSWNSSSRAQIFRRDHHSVTNRASMVKIMRYNNFTTDDLSRCDCPGGHSSELTIAARCDLNLNEPYPDESLGHRPHGATDAKITNADLLSKRSLIAIAGPTTENQKPFVWSESDFDKAYSHVGHPDVWNFTEFTPQWFFPYNSFN